MYNSKIVIGIILIVLLIIFTVQNAAVVSINFLFWQFSVSRVLMIFFLLAIGIIIGLIIAALLRSHKKY